MPWLMLSACGSHQGVSPDFPTAEAEEGPLLIFVTSATHDGAFGNLATNAVVAADAFCNADANKPAGGGSYQALLGSSVRNPSLNWILRPNTPYYRASDAALIGTTNASGTFAFPLNASLNGGWSYYYWTGIKTDWSLNNGFTCANWTTNTSANGGAGIGYSTSSLAIYDANISCGTAEHLVCVKQ